MPAKPDTIYEFTKLSLTDKKYKNELIKYVIASEMYIMIDVEEIEPKFLGKEGNLIMFSTRPRTFDDGEYQGEFEAKRVETGKHLMEIAVQLGKDLILNPFSEFSLTFPPKELFHILVHPDFQDVGTEGTEEFKKYRILQKEFPYDLITIVNNISTGEKKEMDEVYLVYDFGKSSIKEDHYTLAVKLAGPNVQREIDFNRIVTEYSTEDVKFHLDWIDETNQSKFKAEDLIVKHGVTEEHWDVEIGIKQRV